jgi:hypothetical protein
MLMLTGVSRGCCSGPASFYEHIEPNIFHSTTRYYSDDVPSEDVVDSSTASGISSALGSASAAVVASVVAIVALHL